MRFTGPPLQPIFLARIVNNWVDRTLIPHAAPMLMAGVTECVDAGDAAHLRAQMEKIFGMPLEELRASRDTRVKEFRSGALQPPGSAVSVRVCACLSGLHLVQPVSVGTHR